MKRHRFRGKISNKIVSVGQFCFASRVLLFLWNVVVQVFGAVCQTVWIHIYLQWKLLKYPKPMPVITSLLQPNCCNSNKLLHHRLICWCNKAMSSSSNNQPGAFTTIRDTVTFKQEIKKSKFTAIAGHIPDQQYANSFLSQVFSLLGFLFLVSV